MTAIFIYGEEKDVGFVYLLKKLLSKTYRITYIGDNSIFQSGKGYELLAVDFSHYKKIETQRPIFLLKKSSVPHFEFPSEAVVIACSENEKQLRALKGSKAHIITCGFAKTDSFSYSSLCDDKIVVTLNRELTAFSGKKIQPLEIPIEMPEDVDVYSMIAFTALRILLDDFNSDIGELI